MGRGKVERSRFEREGVESGDDGGYFTGVNHNGDR